MDGLSRAAADEARSTRYIRVEVEHSSDRRKRADCQDKIIFDTDQAASHRRNRRPVPLIRSVSGVPAWPTIELVGAAPTRLRSGYRVCGGAVLELPRVLGARFRIAKDARSHPGWSNEASISRPVAGRGTTGTSSNSTTRQRSYREFSARVTGAAFGPACGRRQSPPSWPPTGPVGGVPL